MSKDGQSNVLFKPCFWNRFRNIRSHSELNQMGGTTKRTFNKICPNISDRLFDKACCYCSQGTCNIIGSVSRNQNK